MAAVLGMYLKGTTHEVTCESAGTSENARGGKAAKYGTAAAATLGLDLSGHIRRHIEDLDLASYDLIVCASDEIAGAVIAAGADMGKIYNAQVSNPWPVQFQEDYDTLCMPLVLASMWRVMLRYFR
jgi:protein-tyrosine-phosphatase